MERKKFIRVPINKKAKRRFKIVAFAILNVVYEIVDCWYKSMILYSSVLGSSIILICVSS